MKPIRQVLVIKLSALGDFVLAIPAFERIRAAHADARITLLTTPPFGALAKASPFFDRVETDGRPNSLGGWLSLIARLRSSRFGRVYDLQNSGRTGLYFQALRPFAPSWSGTALGCSLPHRNRGRMKMHALEREAEQLEAAGIWPNAPTSPLSAAAPDVSWILRKSADAPPPPATAARPTVLLVPGGAAHRPEKRWPIEHYSALGEDLQGRGFDLIVIGGGQESELAGEILRRAPRALDLTGRTDLAEVAALGARAALAVGNDTGPMHLITAAGAPAIVLFSSASDPALSAPRGEVTVLSAPDLKDVSVRAVLGAALELARPI
jgi:ADP-heptose:LPS heptosyltransferase